jgi:HlyD family secretion protein
VVTLDVELDAKRVDPRIRPGMSATATITTALHKSAISIPIQALTARAPIREPNPEISKSDSLKQGKDSGDADSRRERRGRSGRGRGSGPNGSMGGEHAGSGPGGEDGEFVKPEPVEVVFIVVTDTTSSGGGLFGSKSKERVEQREVKIGISSDTHYEILTGLEEDEEIVIGNYRAVSRNLSNDRLITRKAQPVPGRPHR